MSIASYTFSVFYFLSLRRREAGAAPAEILHISKEHKIAAEQHFLLGLHIDAKNQLVATVIHVDYIDRKQKNARAVLRLSRSHLLARI